MEYTVKIGGEAGQGIQTIGDTLAKVFSRAGYHVFTHQDYESRIRGGHNFYQIRFSDKPVSASREHIDILVALDRESITLHEKELTQNGRIIYDSATLKQTREESHFLDIPFVRLALDNGGDKIMANAAATGAVMGMLGVELSIFLEMIKDAFRKKGEGIIQANAATAMAGYDFGVKHCTQCSFSSVPRSRPKMVITGVEAIGLGAVSGGCKFYSAYPMTPSTGIMNYLAGKGSEFGIIVEQAEDEIAAVNMALGASFAGVRSMTGTSGGGFALMVEGLSLAGMTETPLVIALGQRPGPATGLPTRTEQGDLLFALHTAHGEFPRIIFAPGTPEQGFFLTNRAFDLAERFQVSVVILFDTYLADSGWTYEGLDLKELNYTEHRLKVEEFKDMAEYRRHAFTDTGVSPLAVPGTSKHVVVTDSDEHSEEGHIVEDGETRIRMVKKRLLMKFPLIRQEISPPFYYGEQNPDIIIIGWGSLYGIMKESVDFLSREEKIGMLHFSEIFPFPSTDAFDYLAFLNRAKLTLCIEQNATGQFARLLRTETGFVCTTEINRYDGRPFLLEELVREINKALLSMR